MAAAMRALTDTGMCTSVCGGKARTLSVKSAGSSTSPSSSLGGCGCDCDCDSDVGCDWSCSPAGPPATAAAGPLGAASRPPAAEITSPSTAGQARRVLRQRPHCFPVKALMAPQPLTGQTPLSSVRKRAKVAALIVWPPCFVHKWLASPPADLKRVALHRVHESGRAGAGGVTAAGGRRPRA